MAPVQDSGREMAHLLAAVNDSQISRIADEAVFLSRENEFCSYLMTVFEPILRKAY